MDKRQKIIVGIIFLAIPILSVIGYGIFNKTTKHQSNAFEIDWPFLRKLNIQTGERPPELAAQDGGLVRIPGFMVPLEDNRTEVNEFLLVPNPQACIHVPPPPANQMVHVTMANNKPTKMTWSPIWIEGRLRIMNISHMYGTSSYQLHAEAVYPYEGGL